MLFSFNDAVNAYRTFGADSFENCFIGGVLRKNPSERENKVQQKNGDEELVLPFVHLLGAVCMFV